MTDIIFSSIVVDLKTALKETAHPFRYFTLATSDSYNAPAVRTVVLRDVQDDLSLMIYTDQRSKKIAHIKRQKWISLLFFDPERHIQIIIKAQAKIITNHAILETIWKQTPLKARKNYTTEFPPGHKLKDPEKIHFLEVKHFFSAIHILPEEIEYLRLKKPTNLRILYKKEHNTWGGNYLVP